MGFEKTAPCRVPQHRKALMTTRHLSLLHVFINAESHSLHIVGTKKFHEMEDVESLWIDDIGVVNGRDVHVIHIRKHKSTTQLQREKNLSSFGTPTIHLYAAIR